MDPGASSGQCSPRPKKKPLNAEEKPLLLRAEENLHTTDTVILLMNLRDQLLLPSWTCPKLPAGMVTSGRRSRAPRCTKERSGAGARPWPWDWGAWDSGVASDSLRLGRLLRFLFYGKWKLSFTSLRQSPFYLLLFNLSFCFL